MEELKFLVVFLGVIVLVASITRWLAGRLLFRMQGSVVSKLAALPVAYLISAIVAATIVGANLGPLFFDEQGYPRHAFGVSLKQVTFLTMTWLISSALDVWLIISGKSDELTPSSEKRTGTVRRVIGIVVFGITNAAIPLSVLVALHAVIGESD